MKDLHITRRQILKGAGAAGVVSVLGVPAAAFAGDDVPAAADGRTFHHPAPSHLQRGVSRGVAPEGVAG